MKKTVYRLSIVATLMAMSTPLLYSQQINEEYKPFSSSSPYSLDDDLDGFGDALAGPGIEKTPIEDGYIALLLLAIPYAISIYKKRDKSI
ncbi:MAG: hypothetical protein ACRCZM_11955 [Bacteroidales bacterium]